MSGVNLFFPNFVATRLAKIPLKFPLKFHSIFYISHAKNMIFNFPGVILEGGIRESNYINWKNGDKKEHGKNSPG